MSVERAQKRVASPWWGLLESGERRVQPKFGEESPDEADGDPGERPPEAELESPDEVYDVDPGERPPEAKLESPYEEYDGDQGVWAPEAELEPPDEESEKDTQDEE